MVLKLSGTESLGLNQIQGISCEQGKMTQKEDLRAQREKLQNQNWGAELGSNQ